MKNAKKLTMLSEDQKAIIKKSYHDYVWNTLDDLGVASNMSVQDLSESSNDFLFDIERHIMMTIAFKEVRKDGEEKDLKKVKKTNKKK